MQKTFLGGWTSKGADKVRELPRRGWGVINCAWMAKTPLSRFLNAEKIFPGAVFSVNFRVFPAEFWPLSCHENPYFFLKKVSKSTVKRSFNTLMQTQLVSALNYLAHGSKTRPIESFLCCGGRWRAGPEVGEGQIFSAHRGQGARYYHVAVKTCT